MTTVHDKGLGLSEPFLDQEPEYGRAIQLFETVLQFVFVGAHLMGQIFQSGEVLVQIVDDHVVDIPDDLNVLGTHPDLVLLDALFHHKLGFHQVLSKRLPFGKKDGVQMDLLARAIQGLENRNIEVLGQQKPFVGDELQEDHRLGPLPL